MHWILQNNIFKEEKFDELVSTLERFDIPHSIHKIIPFVGEIEPDISPDGNVICMGSYSLRHLAKKKGWYPGVFDLEPQNFEVQMQHYGELMLNHDAVVSRFEDAKIIGGHAFMRPIEDSKVFAGKVFTSLELEQWQESLLKLKEDFGTTMNGDTLVQVCPVKEIYAEYRFWIVDQEVVTASQYKLGDEIVYKPETTIDKHVYQFVSEILHMKNGKAADIYAITGHRGWRPHDAWVLDVCETPEGMKVVEINTLNSCGYYAANMTSLVLALEQGFNKKR